MSGFFSRFSRPNSTNTSRTNSPSRRVSSDGRNLSSADAESGYNSASSSDSEFLSHKYVLRVTAGPSYDESTHKVVHVNQPDSPCIVENDFMTSRIVVRIKNYEGLPRASPSTDAAYFDSDMHKNDRYSIAFDFVPKVDIPGSNDLVWGNDFDDPIRDRLPPGFNHAFYIVKHFIDPGLSCDAYADKPWLYGHPLSCWFAFQVGDKLEDSAARPSTPSTALVKEGGQGEGAEIRSAQKIPPDSSKRRKHFLTKDNQAAFTFEKDRAYAADFFNGYLDFQKFGLRLPGFSLGVLKYVNDKTHRLRYVFKNRATNEVYFVVVFTLLFGDELKAALAEEHGGESAHSDADSVD